MSSGALWIKISTDMFNDEAITLIESHPNGSDIIVVWFKLLCLAGTSAGDGILVFKEHIPYTDEMLATIFHKSIQDIRMAMDVLTQFGLVEHVEGTYLIPQWEKYQGSEKLDAIRRKNADRQRKFREKQKQKLLEKPRPEVCNVTGNTPTVTDVTPQIKSKSKSKSNKEHTSKSESFEEAWKLYPNKQGKSSALKAYESAIRNGVRHEDIIAGVERYAEFTRITGQPSRYIKHGDTWFRNRCWEDELGDPSEWETRSGLMCDEPSGGDEGWLNELSPEELLRRYGVSE